MRRGLVYGRGTHGGVGLAKAGRPDATGFDVGRRVPGLTAGPAERSHPYPR